MKPITILLPLVYAAFAATFTLSCSEQHDHAHGEDSDHAHEHGNEADHEQEHEVITPGPNGGRLLTGVEPHLEFLVTEDRKIRITAVDDDAKPIALSGQRVSAVTGDRSAPTRLAFAADGASLLSDAPLPEGKSLPIVVSIKTSADAEMIREKFNVNLADCPTCDYKEYACICGHGEGDHDHDEKKD